MDSKLTRADILVRIGMKAVESPDCGWQETKQYLIEWLNSQEITERERSKIIEDLDSYNY